MRTNSLMYGLCSAKSAMTMSLEEQTTKDKTSIIPSLSEEAHVLTKSQGKLTQLSWTNILISRPKITREELHSITLPSQTSDSLWTIYLPKEHQLTPKIKKDTLPSHYSLSNPIAIFLYLLTCISITRLTLT